jgi:hypothetical protein
MMRVRHTAAGLSSAAGERSTAQLTVALAAFSAAIGQS